MTFTTADYAVIIGYFAIIFYVGFVYARRREAGDSLKEDFILAGRKLTLPLFVATLVATWYGSILGVGEFTYTSGIVAWTSFGLPYYIAALLFAWFAAKKIRASDVTSIPEYFTQKFGLSAGRIASLLVLVITVPAAYALMLGTIVQIFTGWELWQCMIVGAVLSLAYILTGGFRADVFTNVAQFIFMYLGFGILLYFCWQQLGSPGDMLLKLPPAHKALLGTNSWQYALAWFIIALQTFIDPSFHQRCSAAETPKIAQRGIFVSVAFWLIFDFLTISTGLYARAFLTDLAQPLMAFPALGEAVLPPLFKGIFMVALLATVMSTLDSYAFLSGVTIGNDILHPVLKRVFKREFSVKALTQLGLLISSVLSVYFAIRIPTAIGLIYNAASIAVPGMLVPLLISYNRTYFLKEKTVVPIMIISAGISLFWINAPQNLGLKNIEPMIPGIILSLVSSLFFLKKHHHESRQPAG
ncbi:MAG TPA: sodium:solute symporter family protein [Patescibacteria group bacterium]|nr:sodium:solute symporter family protein [Patescibacteria group bacterium]